MVKTVAPARIKPRCQEQDTYWAILHIQMAPQADTQLSPHEARPRQMRADTDVPLYDIDRHWEVPKSRSTFPASTYVARLCRDLTAKYSITRVPTASSTHLRLHGSYTPNMAICQQASSVASCRPMKSPSTPHVLAQMLRTHPEGPWKRGFQANTPRLDPEVVSSQRCCVRALRCSWHLMSSVGQAAKRRGSLRRCLLACRPLLLGRPRTLQGERADRFGYIQLDVYRSGCKGSLKSRHAEAKSSEYLI
jgi:hypothetical protein